MCPGREKSAERSVCTADRREPTPVFVPGKKKFGRGDVRAPVVCIVVAWLAFRE